ncbi:MAG: hypothetical protein RR231_15070 [Acinetobacter sp.]
MTIEEIRKNAPDGATHYHEYNIPVFQNIEYARFLNGVRQIYSHYCAEWIDDVVDDSEQPDSEFKPL